MLSLRQHLLAGKPSTKFLDRGQTYASIGGVHPNEGINLLRLVLPRILAMGGRI